MTEIIEKTGDLFTCPPSTSMAHCVSEDLSMSKGIAVIFKNKFKGIDQLKAQSKFLFHLFFKKKKNLKGNIGSGFSGFCIYM